MAVLVELEASPRVPERVPNRDVARVARLDRDPRDRAEVGDGERARDERPVRRRRRSTCRDRGRPRCHRSRSPHRCRRRSSCRSGRSGRRRSSRSRSSGSRRDLLPERRSRERIGRPPHAATRGADVERHSCGLHFGSTVSAVTRPDHCVGLMKDCVPRRSTFKRVRPDEIPLRGRASRRAWPASALFAVIAFWIWSIEMLVRRVRPVGVSLRRRIRGLALAVPLWPRSCRSSGAARDMASLRGRVGRALGQEHRGGGGNDHEPNDSGQAAANSYGSPFFPSCPVCRESYISQARRRMSRADAPLHAGGTIDSVCAT